MRIGKDVQTAQGVLFDDVLQSFSTFIGKVNIALHEAWENMAC